MTPATPADLQSFYLDEFMDMTKDLPRHNFKQALADCKQAAADEAAANLKLPLWGVSVRYDNIASHHAERATTPGDILQGVALKLQDDETNGSGEIYETVVIEIRRVKVGPRSI